MMTDRSHRLRFSQVVLREVLADPKARIADRHAATARAVLHLRWRDRFTLATRPEWVGQPAVFRRWLLSRR